MSELEIRGKIPKSWLIGGGVGAILLLGFSIKSLPYFLKTKLEQTNLTVGILWTPESYQSLVDHIEENSVPANFIDYLKGKKVKVLVSGDKSLPYSEAQKRIESKQWDIAFTTSPINSIFAKQQGYHYLTRMFPGSSSYQAGLFVRRDSPIQDLNDIKPETVVALGGFTSASSFYMPTYDLYGKKITANTGNRGQTIIELVKEGKADVGAAAIGDGVKKDDSDLRIIHVSRDIPGSGVYLSPNLSESDRENITKLMLNAPTDVQKKANYGEQKEPDYKEFEKIVNTVENDILVCSDFNKNPVLLGCPSNAQIQTIEGKINGVSIIGNNTFLKLSANNQIYNISVPLEITTEVFGSDKLTDIQGKSVVVRTNNIEADNQVIISQSTQLKVVSKTSGLNSSNNQEKSSSLGNSLPTGKVTKIDDGDTITIDANGQKIVIRIACLDSPEMRQEPYGQQSQNFLSSLIPIGTQVSYNKVDTDPYGRTVAEIYQENQLINEQIIASGNGVVYTKYLDNCPQNKQTYLASESKAKEQKLGLWNQDNVCLPWDFRRKKCS